MSADAPDLGATPEQRRRNRALGWTLGVFVVGIMVAFIALFTARGLPKSPQVVERLLREQSAGESVTPATSPIGDGRGATNVAPAQEPR